MSRKIYTYTDLTKLKNSSTYNEIKYYPQITVSSDLRKALKGTKVIDRVDGIFKEDERVHVIEFHTLEVAIDKEINTEQTKFNEIIILSEFFRREIALAGGDIKKKNWLTGCSRNISYLVSSIMLMEQANVQPEDIDTIGDRNLEIFVQAWRYLRERDQVLEKYRNNLVSINSKHAWSQILSVAFRRDFDSTECDTIVFHGFYYITPIQQRIMNMMESAGINLIFVFPYDERFPFVYEIWQKTYSVENGYPSVQDWKMERSDCQDVYGEVFEGKDKLKQTNELKIKEYSSVMEYVDDMKSILDEGYAVYSSDYLTANDILKDYYPDFFGERKILAYPIGQFIGVLNDMWDEDSQSVVLEDENIIDCFASGWLSYNGVSGKQYIQDLMYILPFFSGCKSIAQWEERIKQLKSIQTEVIAPFNQELDAEEEIARWQNAIGNPFTNFSMFAVENEKLDIILSLIQQLLDMATDLFGKNKTVNVSEHIRKLDRILKQYEISNEIYDEERELIGDIFQKLSGPMDYMTKCSPVDIARALNLFICGRFDDGEIQTNKVGMVYPLYFIDAASVKNNSKVHVCMCDVNSLPGKNKNYTWPLTSNVVKDCYKKTGNLLIKNMMHIIDSNSICNRYFIYVALKCDNVVLSWINHVGDKVLAPSPYIKLVGEALGIDITPSKRNTITFSNVSRTPYGRDRVSLYDNSKTPMEVIKEARMAYALCPMKYTLGYILEKYPTYQSEFQQNYAINALISALSELMADSKITVEQIYNHVIELFPHMRKVEKRQVFDYIAYDRQENDMNYLSRSECGGDYYTDERIKIHYPNQQVREVAVSRYGRLMTPDGRKGMNLYEVMEANLDEELVGKKDIIKYSCIFCPHIEYCRNALYAGDQENFYE